MSTDPKQTLDELFPLPKGIKIRSRKFGKNPVSALVPTSVGQANCSADSQRSPFQIDWEDQHLELKVRVREQENGRLIATVFCNNADRLGKAAVSVGLWGTAAEFSIRKSVP